jgi:hypothetical protein
MRLTSSLIKRRRGSSHEEVGQLEVNRVISRIRLQLLKIATRRVDSNSNSKRQGRRRAGRILC